MEHLTLVLWMCKEGGKCKTYMQLHVMSVMDSRMDIYECNGWAKFPQPRIKNKCGKIYMKTIWLCTGCSPYHYKSGKRGFAWQLYTMLRSPIWNLINIYHAHLFFQICDMCHKYGKGGLHDNCTWCLSHTMHSEPRVIPFGYIYICHAHLFSRSVICPWTSI